MKAISQIEIVNYQSHANTVIEPAGAGELTVLTGATDSGKSAVFRALRWLYYGGPVYVRTGCSTASVTVHLEDGTVVTRSRSGSTNRYIVTRPGEEPQVFEGFGRDIPLEVQHALGVRPLDIAGLTLEVNLARQHDPAFLVSGVSAPARAKALGQIAGVEAVDLAMKSAGRDIFEGQRALKQAEAEATELQEQIRQYDYLPALAERIEHAEEVVARLEEAETRKERLLSIKSRLEDTRAQQAQWEAIRRRTAGAVHALTTIDRAQGMVARNGALSRIARTLSSCAAQEVNARAIITRTKGAARASELAAEAWDLVERRRKIISIHERLSRIDADRGHLEQRKAALSSALAAAAPVIEQAEVKIDRRSALLRITETLKQAANDQAVWSRKRDETKAGIRAARDAYTKALTEAGRCPTCGGPVDHQHLREVV